MTVYGERRKKLLSLARGKQVVAMTAPNLFYLTDFFGDGAGIVFPDRTVVVTGPLEQERVLEAGKEVEVVTAMKRKDRVRAIVKQLEKGQAFVDNDLTVRKNRRFTLNSTPFRQARRVKDEIEQGRILKASEGLDKIFESLEGTMGPGRTEWQIAAEVMKLATEQGLTPSSSDASLSPAIIAAGENGALPHSELTGRKLKIGDLVVADIFFRCEGYHSDATRTFAIGSVGSEMKKSYEIVREAQEAALDYAAEGHACREMHLAAVEILKEHGVEKYLNHSVGHGVGIDIHEEPNISKLSKDRLMRNEVVTDEPGIYIKGKYGIRIEDTLRVGRKPVMLTRYTKDLVTCG